MVKIASHLVITFFILHGPATALAEELTFDGPVHFRKNGQNSVSELKSGESIALSSGDSLLVSTEQGLPLLVFSAQSKAARLHVSNADVAGLVQEQLRTALTGATNEIIDGLRRTEAALQKRDYQLALNTITPLKEKYKSIPAVLFLSGTTQFLMNNKSNAADDLQNGLKFEPGNLAARKLLEKIKGSL